MDAEEQLQAIESVSHVADSLTTLRDALVDRGWSEQHSEIAALQIMGPILLAGIASSR